MLIDDFPATPVTAFPGSMCEWEIGWGCQNTQLQTIGIQWTPMVVYVHPIITHYLFASLQVKHALFVWTKSNTRAPCSGKLTHNTSVLVAMVLHEIKGSWIWNRENKNNYGLTLHLMMSYWISQCLVVCRLFWRFAPVGQLTTVCAQSTCCVDSTW